MSRECPGPSTHRQIHERRPLTSLNWQVQTRRAETKVNGQGQAGKSFGHREAGPSLLHHGVTDFAPLSQLLTPAPLSATTTARY